MFLEIKNLYKSYNKKNAVADININLEKGKLLALLGPSGCGKSTILKLLGGFLKADSGQIILDGEDITNLEAQDRHIATVFQSYALFPNMNVIENVSYGLKFIYKDKKKIREIAMSMLEKVGLKSYEKKPISTLSGGEKQRVAIARSLVVKPKLLLLDEPLSNLDAKLRLKLQEQIKKLQKEFEITTIFVTHDQAEAFSIADKIVLMDKGKISQIDEAKDLYNKPKNKFALDFIGNVNLLDDTYVRPEMIKIVQNGKKALIKDIIFKGDNIDLLLEVENKFLKMRVLNQKQEFQIGSYINIDYNLERIE